MAKQTHPHSEGSNGEIPAKEPTQAGPAKATADEKPVEILNKIVAKNIVKRSQLNYRKDGDGKVENEEPRLLYRIFGIAREVRHGDSNYGQWTAFIGSFEAVRFSDHQRFQAPQCFLQGASEGLLLDALKSAQKDDPTAVLGFSFDIGVKPSDKWITEDKGNSYEYTVKTVLKTQQHDPLKELRELVMPSLPVLSAPTR